MKSVIEEIYYGERGNYESIKHSAEYERLKKETDRLYDTLINGITEENKKLLEELYNLITELLTEQGNTHYKEGFKVGLLTVIESLDT